MYKMFEFIFLKLKTFILFPLPQSQPEDLLPTLRRWVEKVSGLKPPQGARASQLLQWRLWCSQTCFVILY